jgi:hypothetical protein
VEGIGLFKEVHSIEEGIRVRHQVMAIWEGFCDLRLAREDEFDDLKLLVAYNSSKNRENPTDAIGICGRSHWACWAELRRTWYIFSQVLFSDNFLDLTASRGSYEDFAGDIGDTRVGLSLEALHGGGKGLSAANALSVCESAPKSFRSQGSCGAEDAPCESSANWTCER